jgi:hypothetical protein
MSKEGQKLNSIVKVDGVSEIIFPEPANTTTKIKSKTMGKGLKIVAKANNRNFKTMFGKKYTYDQKALFILRLAVTDSEKEFGRLLVQGTPDTYNFQPGNKMAPLMRMAKSIMQHDNMPAYVRKRFKKFKMDNGQGMTALSFTNFEKEFNKRKAQALKKVKFTKPKKTPVMRTSDMMDMVENIKKAA